jgi:hypothetical protein
MNIGVFTLFYGSRISCRELGRVVLRPGDVVLLRDETSVSTVTMTTPPTKSAPTGTTNATESATLSQFAPVKPLKSGCRTSNVERTQGLSRQT